MLALLACPQGAMAQGARVSRGLAKTLAAGGGAEVRVIYEGPQSEVDRLASAYGLAVVKRLSGGAVLGGQGLAVEALARDGRVGSLSEDARVFGLNADPAQSTGASLLWKAAGKSTNFSGLVGRGIGVAVIDSGIGSHPDVKNRVLTQVDFTGEGSRDLYGHGTHVAGIIAGSGAGNRTADGSSTVGMAPGAELVSLKVLSADGSGYVSDVIRAIDWAIANKDRFGIRVINLSLGAPAFGSYADDPHGEGRGTRGRGGHRGGGVGGQFRQAAGRHADCRRHRVAGLYAWSADGWRAQHQGHRAAERRRSGELQLARAGG